ncbi:aminotransferase class III-fold pyridoxal phosphate-dependent enzyme [Microbacterium oleivorans]|uniref:Aminotransferase class III-fold pyridoxal phosphate-dependent enzyme n=1 Tax=Microbacterium oleivorans TaxID=273677 RepID=A0A7D5EXX6_9MICO|nr:aminotransferase class III-fold pyridoxal phosphate-dependent enzyme [Microbacterium oleivorans]QLD11488.1 aminotransferase class III-fold pyridoxal phosphate-dependent enzyme [Microbacterium oleivorans]
MTIPENDRQTAASTDASVPARAAGSPPLLPVAVATGEGAWVTDVEGRRYLDLTAEPALTFGHRHPALVAVATEQLGRLTVASAAVDDDRSDPFARGLADLVGAKVALPVATPQEAVDVAVTAARRSFAERSRGRTEASAGARSVGRAPSVIVAAGSHDRLVEAGAVTVPFGDVAALEAALDNTHDEGVAAVVLEPVQVAAGVVAAPEGYLDAVRRSCAERGIVFVLDESHSGAGRLGETVALDTDAARPDLRVLGSAFGGGIVPLAAVAGSTALLTGLPVAASASPLATAVGHRVVEMLATGELQIRAGALAEHLSARIEPLLGAGATAVRAVGVWAGVDLDPAVRSASEVARRLVARGVLVDVVGETTLLLEPPLVIRATELDWAIEQLRVVLAA